MEPNALTVDIVGRRPMPGNSKWRLSTWKKPEIACISAKDRLTCKISMAIPTFSSTQNLMHLQLTLSDVVQCLKIQNGGYPPGKSLKLPVSQQRIDLHAKFQRLYLHFRVHRTWCTYSRHCPTSTNAWKFKIAAIHLEKPEITCI